MGLKFLLNSQLAIIASRLSMNLDIWQYLFPLSELFFHLQHQRPIYRTTPTLGNSMKERLKLMNKLPETLLKFLDNLIKVKLYL